MVVPYANPADAGPALADADVELPALTDAEVCWPLDCEDCGCLDGRDCAAAERATVGARNEIRNNLLIV
jgi:hypothetical protein